MCPGSKGKKKVEAAPVRGNSTSAMQEAKKLMESRAGHVHMAAPRADTTVTISARLALCLSSLEVTRYLRKSQK